LIINLLLEVVMPFYEYRCQECRKKFDVRLSYSEYDKFIPVCPACSSKNISRIIRAVRVATNDITRLADMADPASMDALDEDPRKLGKMMRDMRNQVGADDLPGEFDEMVDRLEKGQTPDEIENDLPELASPSGDDE
jgi:putative FmdB family regulatory protein